MNSKYETTGGGTKRWCDEDGLLHRTNGPAGISMAKDTALMVRLLRMPMEVNSGG
jgi:hypothetical protein